MTDEEGEKQLLPIAALGSGSGASAFSLAAVQS